MRKRGRALQFCFIQALLITVLLYRSINALKGNKLLNSRVNKGFNSLD